MNYYRTSCRSQPDSVLAVLLAARALAERRIPTPPECMAMNPSRRLKRPLVDCFDLPDTTANVN